MEDIVLLGCGGHARSVTDSIEQSGRFHIAGFVDKNMDSNFSYRNHKVIGNDDDLQKIYDSGIHYAFVGIAYLGKSDIRDRLYRRLKEIGYILPIIMDCSAVVAMAIINTAAIVEHDCQIGRFCHIAVSSTICGGANIGSNTLIGANATIIQSVNIGKNCIIGAGSVVRKDIEDNMLFKDGQKMQNLNRR